MANTGIEKSIVMNAVVFKCPRTGRSIHSGVETDDATLRGLGWVVLDLRCVHCKDTHRLPISTARFEPFVPPLRNRSQNADPRIQASA